MDKKKLAISVIVGTLMVISAIYVVTVSKAEKPFQVEKVKMGTFKETILASAKVAPPVREVNFEMPGKIKKIYVKEGDKVTAGQTLAELDDETLLITLEQAEANYAAANAGVQIAKVGQNDSNLLVDIAQLSLDKLVEGATAGQRAPAQAMVNQARTNLESAQTSLANVQEISDNTVEQADAAVDAAQQSLNDLEDIADAAEDSAAQAVDDAEQLVEDTEQYYDDVQQLAASGEPGYNAATISLAKIQLDSANAQLNQSEIQQDLVESTNEQSLNAAEAGVDQAELSQNSTNALNQQNIDMATSAVAAAQRTLELAQAQYAQLTEPARNEDVGILQDQVDQAKNNQQRSGQTVVQLEGMARVAKTAVDLAKKQLDAATLTAPVDGLVSQVNGDEGELYNPPTPGLGGKPFLSIVADNKIEIETEIDDNDIGKVKIGQKVINRFDAFPGTDFEGTIVEIPLISSLNSVGDTVFKAKAELASYDSNLKVGIEGDALIETESIDQLIIPAEAVVKIDGKTFAYIAEGGKAYSQRITLGPRSRGEYIVISGLGADQLVITSDTDKLVNGQTITIKQ